MTYATIHLHLTPHPAPTSLGAIDYACAMAKVFEAKLDVSSSLVSVNPPANWLTGGMIAQMARDLEAKTAETTAKLESHLEASALAAVVEMRLTRVPEQWPVGVSDNSWRGRTSDICVLSLSPGGMDARLGIEDWLFGSGRPCILYPESSKQAFSIENVLICWDFSRSAARTVSDALPLLHNAKRIRIAIFRGEKDIAVDDPGKPLIAFLAEHGIAAEAEDVVIGDRTIGGAILEHASSIGADLILMGAFGHSRMQEFILGGATKEILDRSTTPLFMSH
jgi:nucleotide-binding universal stress UspA family protein